jgi:hypothetical protein
MKLAITYSLFGDPSSFEFGYYLRGVYFNFRMNRILFPSFENHLRVSKQSNSDLINSLWALFPNTSIVCEEPAPKCESMLWRMKQIFEPTITHVICRDLDSVSTYREALCTYEWLNSGMPYHAINDNDAHAGLMGGLVAFRSEDFKRDTGYTSFEQMIKGQDLSKHGSDQNFMNRHIHSKIKKGLMMHKLKGAGVEAAVTKTEVPASGPINKKLWTSDLISRYIGSAGVIDFELIRFFQYVDRNPKFDAFERKYSDIFYWAR